MKVYTLSGKSGTGKSYQAVNLCRQKNIESIIDDGLFIYKNKLVAGISDKRQPTKIGAVRTALFLEDDHRDTVAKAIKKQDPKSILVLGTSDEMVDRIIAGLRLPEPEERVYIEEITTEEEREAAHRQRNEQGQHVIPAPTFQIKRQFSGYFMSPMKILKDFNPWGAWRDNSEKSVVRPTYSYLGKYRISEKVMSDIIECIKEECGTVYEVLRVTVTEKKDATAEGVEIYVIANLKYGSDLPGAAGDFQQRIARQIENMTAFNVNRVDLEIRDVI